MDRSTPSGTRRASRFPVRAILATGFVLVALAVLVFVVRYEVRGKYVAGTDDAYIQADAIVISPKISGYVEQVYVRDNQDVRAGQTLLRIDPREYSAATAQYRAQIDLAQANVANARSGIREQRAAIDQARAQLASAEADARFAAEEVARYAPLAQSGAETGEKLASLRNRATQTATMVAAQRAALDMATRRIASLDAQVRQAQAQGESAAAQQNAADVNLSSTIIRAPADGRIGDKSVRIGQFVQTGTRTMSLVPLGSIYVMANFKETQIGLMRPGQPATIKVDALPGVGLRGHVESISPGTGAQFSLIPPQNATGNFTKIVQRVPVRVSIDAGAEARKVLVPGLSVTVDVDTISAKGAEHDIARQEASRRRRAS